MIICRTPFRISFFGGGTDYPAWYLEHGGAVLATTIDKYCYLTVRYLPPFFEHRLRVVYSRVENCLSVDDVQHPAVREILRYLGISRGLEIHHDGDLPARSGMGSSSSFTVGLLHALHALEGRMASKSQLAKESIHVEQERLREAVGSQDQVLAAHGGFNHICFHPRGEIDVHPVVATARRVDELQDHLMLFYTGIKRTASNIAAGVVAGMESKKRQLRILQDLVREGLTVLGDGGDLTRFGDLLHEAWQVKRGLTDKVTSDDIDRMYEAARTAGAVGGKITGAGGGGFMLLFVPPDRRAAVRAALPGLIHVPFRFDWAGSQILFIDRQEDYADLDAARDTQRIQPFRELEPGAPGAGS